MSHTCRAHDVCALVYNAHDECALVLSCADESTVPVKEPSRGSVVLAADWKFNWFHYGGGAYMNPRSPRSPTSLNNKKQSMAFEKRHSKDKATTFTNTVYATKYVQRIAHTIIYNMTSVHRIMMPRASYSRRASTET